MIDQNASAHHNVEDHKCEMSSPFPTLSSFLKQADCPLVLDVFAISPPLREELAKLHTAWDQAGRPELAWPDGPSPTLWERVCIASRLYLPPDVRNQTPATAGSLDSVVRS
jgi:hypothetical protein